MTKLARVYCSTGSFFPGVLSVSAHASLFSTGAQRYVAKGGKKASPSASKALVRPNHDPFL